MFKPGPSLTVDLTDTILVLQIPKDDVKRLQRVLREDFPNLMSPRKYEVTIRGAAEGSAYMPAHEMLDEKMNKTL